MAPRDWLLYGSRAIVAAAGCGGPTDTRGQVEINFQKTKSYYALRTRPRYRGVFTGSQWRHYRL